MPNTSKKSRISAYEKGDTRKSQAPAKPLQASSRWKKWGFRLGSMVLLPAFAILCLETALRLAGYGYPTSFFLRKEIAGHNVLVPNDKFGWRFFGPELARTPRPMEIPTDKPPQTCRIFVFGESAAYGDPKPEFGLPRFLEVLLRDKFPEIHFEVINVAMTGINSHVILPIARDCARQDGDIWVIYMGNNEVVGPFGSGTVFSRQTSNLSMIRASIALKATRIGELMSRLPDYARPATAADSEWGGMAMFVNNQVRHDDPAMPVVYSHFQRNLKDIIQTGLSHRAGLIVSTVAVNLKDCAPFGSQHRADLIEADRSRWQHSFNEGIQDEKAGNASDALKHFESAASLDDHYAELHFRWGRCCLALGRDNPAREHFSLARDYDTLRFRADTRINEIIRRTAAESDLQRVRLVDSATELAGTSPQGVIGSELLYEHVHLNFEGNYRLALGIASQVMEVLPPRLKGLGSPKATWLSEAECAQRLAWTDWDRYRAYRSVLLRLCQPPFISQINQPETYQRTCHQLEALLPAQRIARLRQCAEQYRQAIELSPDDWVLRRNQADLLRGIGELLEAEADLRRSIELLPHDSMGHLELGLLLVQSRRPKEAINEFDEVLKNNPRSIAALNGTALALNELQQWQEAIKTLEMALQFGPHSVDTHLNLATVMEANGGKARAEENLRRALQEKVETPEMLARLGKLCMVHGWVDEAITNFSRAVLLNPTDAKVQAYLGGALDTRGRVAEAQEHFTAAVRLDPELPTGHLGLGTELSRQGKDSEAIVEFSAAVKFDPNLIDARVRLGVCLMRQRKFDEARHQFEEVLTLQPTNSMAQKYLLMIPKAQQSLQ